MAWKYFATSLVLMSTVYAAPKPSEDHSGYILQQRPDGQATVNTLSGSLSSSYSSLSSSLTTTTPASLLAAASPPPPPPPPLLPPVLPASTVTVTSTLAPAPAPVPAPASAAPAPVSPPAVNVYVLGDDDVVAKQPGLQMPEGPVPTATTINGRLYAIVHPKSTVIDGATYILPETVISSAVPPVAAAPTPAPVPTPMPAPAPVPVSAFPQTTEDVTLLVHDSTPNPTSVEIDVTIIEGEPGPSETASTTSHKHAELIKVLTETIIESSIEPATTVSVGQIRTITSIVHVKAGTAYRPVPATTSKPCRTTATSTEFPDWFILQNQGAPKGSADCTCTNLHDTRRCEEERMACMMKGWK